MATNLGSSFMRDFHALTVNRVNNNRVTKNIAEKAFGKIKLGWGKLAKGALAKIANVHHSDKPPASSLPISDDSRRAKLEEDFLTAPTFLFDKKKWRAVRKLGKGGQGVAGLWVQLDHRDIIVNRMVIKEAALMSDASSDIWLPGHEENIARDAAIHMVLSPGPGTKKLVKDYAAALTPTFGPTGPPSHSVSPTATVRTSNSDPDLIPYQGIVDIYNHTVQPQRRSYRIYLEYLSQGSLQDLCDKYSKPYTTWERVNGQIRVCNKYLPPIPEPFLWVVLYRLMLACRAMEAVDRIQCATSTFVVHQDIKPDNVFMGEPDPHHHPMYLLPKIGDFGSARLTYPGDAGNPTAWRRDPLTMGYAPVEYRYSLDGQHPLTSAVNVWQCAATILTLMRRQHSGFQYMVDERPDMSDIPDMYTYHFVALIDSCLDPDPSKRPGPQTIINYVEKWEQRVLQGMQDPEVARTKKEHHLHLEEQIDQYKQGMTYYDPDEEMEMRTMGF